MNAWFLVPALFTVVLLFCTAFMWWVLAGNRDRGDLITLAALTVIALVVIWFSFAAGRASRPTYILHVAASASGQANCTASAPWPVAGARRGHFSQGRSIPAGNQSAGSAAYDGAGPFTRVDLSSMRAVSTGESNTGVRTSPHAAGRLTISHEPTAKAAANASSVTARLVCTNPAMAVSAGHVAHRA